jgi:hypothetical protein
MCGQAAAVRSMRFKRAHVAEVKAARPAQTEVAAGRQLLGSIALHAVAPSQSKCDRSALTIRGEGIRKSASCRCASPLRQQWSARRIHSDSAKQRDCRRARTSAAQAAGRNAGPSCQRLARAWSAIARSSRVEITASFCIA